MYIPKLREQRELQGLTQKDLALKSGVSVRSIAGYEAGAGVRPNTARKLAEALGVEVADLVVSSGKAAAPSPLEPSFEDLLEGERRIAMIRGCFRYARGQADRYERRLHRAEQGGAYAGAQGAQELFDDAHEELGALGSFLIEEVVGPLVEDPDSPIWGELRATLDRLAETWEKAGERAQVLAQTEAEKEATKEAIRRRREIYARNMGRLSA